MLQSLLALPVGVLAEILSFVMIYRFTSLGARSTALLIGMLSLAVVVAYALFDWPGADVLAMYCAVVLLCAYLLGVVAHSREVRERNAGTSGWFHWGPAAIVLFFAGLFVLNGFLVMISRDGLPKPLADWLLPGKDGTAVSSVFPGTVARDYQKKESDYNLYLDQLERQNKLGWQVQKGWLTEPAVGTESVFRVQVSSQDGSPLSGSQVQAFFQRPSDSRHDRSADLKEVQPGVYQAAVNLPEPGNWNLWLQISRDDQLFELHAATRVMPVE